MIITNTVTINCLCQACLVSLYYWHLHYFLTLLLVLLTYDGKVAQNLHSSPSIASAEMVVRTERKANIDMADKYLKSNPISDHTGRNFRCWQISRQREGRKCAVWLQSRLTVGVTDLGLPGAASRKCKPTKPIWAFGIETKDQTCVALSGLSAHAKITFLHDTMQSRQRKIHWKKTKIWRDS